MAQLTSISITVNDINNSCYLASSFGIIPSRNCLLVNESMTSGEAPKGTIPVKMEMFEFLHSTSSIICGLGASEKLIKWEYKYSEAN